MSIIQGLLYGLGFWLALPIVFVVTAVVMYVLVFGRRPNASYRVWMWYLQKVMDEQEFEEAKRIKEHVGEAKEGDRIRLPKGYKLKLKLTVGKKNPLKLKKKVRIVKQGL